jgi:hypothetical protein
MNDSTSQLPESPINISLSSSEFGDLSLIVPDINKYLAHVPYQTGMLTMYMPEVHGVMLIPAIYTVFVITDHYNRALDFMGWTRHNADMDGGEVIHEALETISELYLRQVTEFKLAGVTDGTISMQ